MIKPNDQAAYDNTIFKAGKIHARFGFFSLLLRRPCLKSLVIDDFVINVQYDVNNRKWNAGILGFAKGTGTVRTMPNVR